MAVTVELIDIGALANDGTGDPLRVAFDKINNNFSTLSGISFPTPGGDEGSLQFKQGNSYTGSPNLFFSTSNNALVLKSNVNVGANAIVDIGSNTSPIHKLYLSNTGLDVGNINIAEVGNTISFSITGRPGAGISLAGLNDIQVSGNIITSGNVALGNSLAYGNTIIGSLTVTTPNAALNQVIYETPANTFTSGKFKITSSRNVSADYTQSAVLEIVVTNDKNTIRYNAHSTVFSGVPVTKYNVDLHFSNVRIMVSPQFADPVIHLISYEIDN
jgi:hypothetical protein